MNKHIILIPIGVLLVLICLSGCWDQRLLKDHSLVLALGYDRAENEELLNTVIFPNPTSASSVQGGASSESGGSKIVTTTGNTVKDAEKKMDQIIPELFDRTKTRFILFGDELAKEGFFLTLDSLYRDLRGPLSANLAIFAGEAKDALSIKEEKSFLTSDHYADLLDSAEQSGIIKNYSVQIACPVMLADGVDLVLPYVALDEEKEVQIKGSALFHGDKMTGTLDLKETTLHLLLTNQITKNEGINLKISNDKEEHIKNFVNIAIRSNKQKLHVDVTDDAVKANVHIDLRVEIDEFADDDLENIKKVKNLEKEIKTELEKLAEKTIKKMQEAGNDSLGIGEKLRAFHHTTWEKIDWSDMYPNIPLHATFTVEIVHRGITN